MQRQSLPRCAPAHPCRAESPPLGGRPRRHRHPRPLRGRQRSQRQHQQQQRRGMDGGDARTGSSSTDSSTGSSTSSSTSCNSSCSDDALGGAAGALLDSRRPAGSRCQRSRASASTSAVAEWCGVSAEDCSATRRSPQHLPRRGWLCPARHVLSLAFAGAHTGQQQRRRLQSDECSAATAVSAVCGPRRRCGGQSRRAR